MMLRLQFNNRVALSSCNRRFNEVKEIFSSPFGKVSFWLVYSSFIYHLVAGIRHLVMDVGVGHTLKGSNRASTIVLVVSGVLMVAGAVWIW
ncbi:succinate dehydrogenase, cytochrome b556 subunit [Pseudomonas aeruginosa]|uniref:succinate dehydrogenase, cytochrome b556 subunit n=1 Tax=Pseudomonas aeruginosa TaxID=287 RepID=UPI00315DF8BA